MGLTVGGWQIAELRVQSAILRPIVGGFELVFGLWVEIRAIENVVRRASIAGSRISVRPDDGKPWELGFARPETPLEITSMLGGMTASHDLHLYLQPGQLAALESLQRGEEQYRSGDYHSCIGSCRTAMEELGIHRHGNREWASKALAPLASPSTRRIMDRAAREAALYAALRHYTHQAHHGPSVGGATAYTRAEAQFVIGLSAAAVAHAQVA